MCDLCIIQGSCCFGLDKMNPQGSHTENTEQSPGSTSGEGVSGPEAWGIMKIGPINIITNNPRMWGRPVCYVLSYISSHCTSREPSVGAGPVPQTETELRGEATCPSSQRSSRTSRPAPAAACPRPSTPAWLPAFSPRSSLGPHASHQRGHQGTSSWAQRANRWEEKTWSQPNPPSKWAALLPGSTRAAQRTWRLGGTVWSPLRTCQSP